MDIKEELIYGKGWVLVDVDKPESLDRLCQSFIHEANKIVGNDSILNINDFIDYLLTLNDSEANTLKLKLIFIKDLALNLQKSFIESTIKLTGHEIFLQRRSHVMFNIPGHTQPSMQHIDGMSGISPYAYIIWAPLHDITDDSGIYALDQHSSMKIMNEEKQNGYVMGNAVHDYQFEPLQMPYGKAIIFNPFVLHGSIPHKGGLPRIGITNRFQSRLYPLFLRDSDFFTPCNI